MALPVPNLDDRRFQDLVDDAKRLVQQRCPEWTDHNVSDPGVTLIEAFAFMTDQLLYRLNRVPERHYRKFLDLIGVRLFPPTAARTPLTFYLTAPQAETVRIAAGTQAATVRTETDEAIVFTTLDDLPIVPCSFSRIATGSANSDAGSGASGSGGSSPAASEGEGPKAGAGTKSAASAAPVDRTDQLAKEKAFEAFQPVPQPGDVLLVGLSDPIPSCAVSLRFQCSIEGVGVDPENPPIGWEAWTGEAWTACELERDSTGGLNRDGEVLLHVPAGHTASLVAKQRAGWIRARVVTVEEGQTAYSASPKIQGVTAATVGGTTTGVHAEVVTNEIVGASAGVGGERFQLLRHPVVPGDRPTVLRVSTDDSWEDWTQVPDFASSSATDRQFVLDAEGGEILLGPGVREADGSYRQFGAVPAKGARLQVAEYLTGGGRRGNVATGAVVVLRSSIPFVGRVANRHPGLGGVDGEDVENAKVRGPISLRTRGRAVTAEDYEQIVREAAPEVARVRGVPATEGPEAGSVRVLVVPAAESIAGQLRFEQLVPAEETLARITARLDECRVIGARVLVEPPAYRGITIVARLKPRPRVNPTRLQAEAAEALATYFHPILGGPTGDGWPFGRPVQIGEVYAVLQALPGTEIVEDARLFGADPITGQRGQATQRLDLEPNALVFSYEHQLMVEGA